MDPANSLKTNSFGDVLLHQPLEELILDLVCEGLVVPDIYGLYKPGTAGQNELDFDANSLDLCDGRPHHVNAEGVQVKERQNSGQGHCNIGPKDFHNPLQHNLFCKPHLWLALVNCAIMIDQDFATFDCPPSFSACEATHMTPCKG